jgi:DNA-directed RNA polymerase subunit RPC12/RpoP
MSQQSVKCAKCGRELVVDESRAVAVGGGAMPVAEREKEMMCPECRIVTRFSDESDGGSSGGDSRKAS